MNYDKTNCIIIIIIIIIIIPTQPALLLQICVI